MAAALAGKILAKCAKYGLAVFTGYEVKEQLTPPQVNLLKAIQPAFDEKKVAETIENDLKGALNYVIILLFAMLGVFVFFAVGYTAKKICKSVASSAIQDFKEDLEKVRL